MEYFSRRLNNIPTQCVIYTEEEAKEQKLNYKYWRDIVEKDLPCWALTDDGYVGECLEVKRYKNRGRLTTEMLKFTFARTSKHSRKPLLWEVRRDNRAFSTISDQDWIVRTSRKRATREAISVYVESLLSRGNVDMNMVGKIYNPHASYPAGAFRKYLKQEEVQRMVGEEIKKRLHSKGLNEDWVINNFKEVAEASKATGKFEPALKAIGKIAQYLGMEDKVEVTKKDEFNFDSMLGSIEGKGSLEMRGSFKSLPEADDVSESM